MANVPLLVIGLPLTVSHVGTVTATLVTVPPAEEEFAGQTPNATVPVALEATFAVIRPTQVTLLMDAKSVHVPATDVLTPQ